MTFNVERNGRDFFNMNPGMQKYMKESETNSFSRFIAANAQGAQDNCLYSEFCKKENGEEEIIYDLDACELLKRYPMGIHGLL
jgi:DNA polymerase-3 subunit alpha